MTQRIKESCYVDFPAAHSSGKRKPSDIKWIVVHDTEGGSARSVAMMFSRDDATASTHLVVDEVACYRMLDDMRIPWGAPGANKNGYHIEHVGYARWTREQWLDHAVTLQRGAYKAALRCKRYGIPARWVGPWGLRLGRKGLTTHADVSRWQGTPGGHTDPGPNFPKDIYLELVQHYLAEMSAPSRLDGTL